jgi:hypothetical protein
VLCTTLTLVNSEKADQFKKGLSDISLLDVRQEKNAV